jgi:hypothetical protein
MTRALVLLCAWLAVACSLAATSPVVTITAPNGSAICSAFAVQPNRLLTAAHCVHTDPVRYERTAPVVVGLERAAVLRVNVDQDWAVLEPAAPLPVFATAAPVPGVLAVRDQLGALREPYFDGFAPDGASVERWSAALDVVPGWSGSPVLQGGRAIGILQSCRGVLWPVKACARPGLAFFFPATAVPQ